MFACSISSFLSQAFCSVVRGLPGPFLFLPSCFAGFRAFRPSTLGKISTVVQILAVATVILAAQTRVGTGYYLPTLYALVFTLTVLSGVHYVFFVSQLLNDDRR